AGGAVGGVFVALVGPRIFPEFSEYPAGLAAACLLGFAGWARSGALAQWTSHNFAVRIPLMALLLGGITAIAATVTSGAQPALASHRSFYGILRVTQRAAKSGAWRALRRGHVVAGRAFLEVPKRPIIGFGPIGG